MSLGLDLVPSTARPGITLDDAINAVDANSRPNAGPPSGNLVTASDGDWGIGQAPNQTSFTDRLSWLLAYPDAEPMIRGGLGMTAEERERLAASLTCTDFRLVDARTAKVLKDYQTCRP